ELLAENDRTAAVLREERRRADELAEVNARMEASLREREAAVADRDAQLADLREKLTAAAGRAPAPSVGGVGGAAASSQGLAPPAIRGSGSAIEVGSGPAAFGGADGRPAAGNVVQSGREEDGRQDAMLREQMSDLA